MTTITATPTITTGQMHILTDRFKDILATPAGDTQDMRLASLMTNMETAFGISMLRNESFEAVHPHLMQMYRTVSDARTFGEVE